MKYYSIHQFSKLINRTPQTLRNWDKSGRLHPHHTGPNGYRYYSDKQLKQVLQLQDDAVRKIIGYCRVSNSRQKDNLQNQMNSLKTYLYAQGKPFEIISDIGSNVDYKRKGFLLLLDMLAKGEVEKIIILNKDRLLTFGYEIFEYVANLHDCTIEIVDCTNKVEQEEFAGDLIRAISAINCKPNIKHSNKMKKIIRQLLSDSLF